MILTKEKTKTKSTGAQFPFADIVALFLMMCGIGGIVGGFILLTHKNILGAIQLGTSGIGAIAASVTISLLAEIAARLK